MEEAVTKRLNKRAVSLGPKSDVDVPVSLGNKDGLELASLPRAEKTLGKIIAKPDSPDRIDGVKIEPLQVHPDDRGFFMELARLGEGLTTHMVPEGQRQIQVSFTLTYPGTIKAIHYHLEQTDLWAPVSEMMQVSLYDLRQNSRAFGEINTICAGKFPPLGDTDSTWSWPRLQGAGRRTCSASLFHRPPLQFRRRITDRLQRPRDWLRLGNSAQMNPSGF